MKGHTEDMPVNVHSSFTHLFFVVSILNNKHVIFNKIILTFFGCNENVKVLHFQACIMDCKVIKRMQHGGFHECCNKATRRNENEIRN